jgi:hypothetical protein
VNCRREYLSGLWAVLLVLGAVVGVNGQDVVINELVKEERTGGTGVVTPDNREFIELYNRSASPVDIGGWTIRSVNLNTGVSIPDSLPAGATIPANGFYVVAVEGRAITGANHYIPLGAGDEFFPDQTNLAIELLNSGGQMQDAVGVEIFRNPQLANMTTEQAAQIGNGAWSLVHSYNIDNSSPDFSRLSYARYRDGRDTNKNGRDFGFLPLTPGASNNLPLNDVHTVPNVDGLNHGDFVTQYNYSFDFNGRQAVRAIDPGTADAINPSVISPSPQGGKAMINWDQSGGGSVAYSKELVNSFELYAYLDSTNLNMPGDWEAEWTAYGIGSADPQFQTPNLNGLIPGTGTTTVRTQNGSTGIGWLFERFQQWDTVNQVATNSAKLSLVDFGEGGNSVPTAADKTWNIIETFELTPAQAGWHKLALDYDPATGVVTATFDQQTRTFTPANHSAENPMLGTFFSGYREGLTGVPANNTVNNVPRARPATWDMISMGTVENADFDGDGDVDGADFLTWQRNVGTNGGQSQGNANGQGAIDGADLAIWKAQFGPGTPVSAIPEPNALALAAFAVALIAAGRKSFA